MNTHAFDGWDFDRTERVDGPCPVCGFDHLIWHPPSGEVACTLCGCITLTEPEPEPEVAGGIEPRAAA